MTCKEIGEYVENQEQKQKDSLLITTSIGYRLAEMLILSNSMCVKKPKVMKFEELFPELTKESSNSKEEEIENKWREFLGVVR